MNYINRVLITIAIKQPLLTERNYYYDFRNSSKALMLATLFVNQHTTAAAPLLILRNIVCPLMFL